VEKFIFLIENYLVPPLTKLGDVKFLKAVRNGMIATVPFTIFGSIFMIISFIPIQAWTNIVKPYQQLLSIPISATFGLLSIIVSISIAYNYARELKQDAIIGSLMSLIGFILLQVDPETGSIATANFSASGMFTAIVVAFIAIQIQRFFVLRNLVIKLPENVPPAVSRSFISLTPTATLLTFLWLVRFVGGVDINAIVTMIFQPFVFALNTLPGLMVMTLIISLLWFVGIHGDNVVSSVASPICLTYLAANASAMVAGQPLPYIGADGFNAMFVNVGGTGTTLALVLILMRSKEIGLRQLSRMAFPSACFQINEPVIFGVPVMLNPILLIPYVIVPQILVVGTYFLMAANIINKPCIMVPWTTPPIIGQYLATGGDWRAAVWAVVSIVIAFIVYYPFARSLEKQRLAEEASGNTGE
jgi:PTS system cellobiose-specific IIC component